MKKLFVIALILSVLAPVAAAQTGTSFTGKWEGSFVIQPPEGDGKRAETAVFILTQKGKVLTGTAGPADRQRDIAKGVVKNGVATFELQQPNGPLFNFSLSIVKGRLQGDMKVSGGGKTATAKVDAARVK